MSLAAGLRAAVAAGPADPALAELRQAARSALAAMRRVLTVLRSADDDAIAPQDPPPRRWWSWRPPSTSGLVLTLVTAAGVLGNGGATAHPDWSTPPWIRWSPAWTCRLGRASSPCSRCRSPRWRGGARGRYPALLVATAASGVLAFTGSAHFVAKLRPRRFVGEQQLGVRCHGAAGCTVVLGGGDPDEHAGPLAHRRRMGGRNAGRRRPVAGRVLVGARGRRGTRRAERAAERSRAQLGDERLGIARELHDLVAHHASAVAVQASAARSNPAALPDAVTHIEEGGLRIAEAVRALADLAPPTRPPAPLSRAGVEELLAPARAAGLPVTAEVEGSRPPSRGRPTSSRTGSWWRPSPTCCATPGRPRRGCGCSTGRRRWSSRSATAACCPGTGP